jgi:RNA polymerase sigma-70 factor (ECF subfamily)
VNAALAQLPERQRAAIALVHFDEMSNIAAAEILEISVEALESLLARGRRALKAALADVAQDLMGGPEGGP